ncbi:hypothetical protein ACSFEV_12130 [Pseudomonas fulva]|uniref:hypothetical protein n=1 Tax=Pseudomonas fulva TaxID=47880 RepID=UPI003EE97A1F
MQQRGEAFFKFFQRYPTAVIHDQKHENGRSSTISVGLVQGHVDAAFIGIYREDGSPRSEEHWPWDIVEDSFGKGIGNSELLGKLTETAVAKAGAPIIR